MPGLVAQAGLGLGFWERCHVSCLLLSPVSSAWRFVPLANSSAPPPTSDVSQERLGAGGLPWGWVAAGPQCQSRSVDPPLGRGGPC